MSRSLCRERGGGFRQLKHQAANRVEESSTSVEQFVQLLSKHQRGIQAYIWTLIPNRADSDDLMQETSVALWRKWPEFDPSRDFFRWACGIAFIEVLRVRRKTATSRLWFSQELMETLAVEFVDDAGLLDLRSDALRKCLDKLSERDRKIVKCRYWDGQSAKAVADEVRRPVSTLYKIDARIRDQLHQCIEGSIARQAHP